LNSINDTNLSQFFTSNFSDLEALSAKIRSESPFKHVPPPKSNCTSYRFEMDTSNSVNDMILYLFQIFQALAVAFLLCAHFRDNNRDGDARPIVIAGNQDPSNAIALAAAIHSLSRNNSPEPPPRPRGRSPMRVIADGIHDGVAAVFHRQAARPGSPPPPYPQQRLGVHYPALPNAPPGENIPLIQEHLV